MNGDRTANDVRDTHRILLYMGVFLAAATAVCAALYAPLRQAFLANQVFNGMIIGVLVVGIAINARHVVSLARAIRWLQAFKDRRTRLAVETRPELLAPIQSLLQSVHAEGFRLPALTMRTMLDSIRLRLDESRELSRYLIGLLIFLGLLGTFWGLLDTVGSVSGVIASLSTDGNLASTFDHFKSNLQQPLAGMGTAFSSSLFGLGGALILGFIDLQAGHAQNRCYNHLEEWLSELIHLPTAIGAASETFSSEGHGYVEVLLEQAAEQLSDLDRISRRGEEERRETRETLRELSSRLAALTAQMATQDRLLEALSRHQLELEPLVKRLTESGRTDEAMLEHLRNLDVNIGQVLQELASGGESLSAGVRQELRLLTRALARGTRHEERTD